MIRIRRDCTLDIWTATLVRAKTEKKGMLQMPTPDATLMDALDTCIERYLSRVHYVIFFGVK